MKQAKPSFRFGEFFVRIEYCSNCSAHNGSLRHDEEKYASKAQKLKDLLTKEFPFLTIILEPLQLQISSRLGCFEVYYADYVTQQEHLVSSKLNTLKWPEPKVVVNNIRNFMRPKRLEVELVVKELERLAEKQRNLENVRCLLISEVDFPRVVECLKTLQIRQKSSASDTLTSMVNRPRVGSCYSGKNQKSAKPIRQIQSGMVHKKQLSTGHSRKIGTAPEFRSGHLTSIRMKRKSRNRVLSAIVVRKLERGETDADLIKHLLENKPCVFEEGVNNDSKVLFPKVGPGRYRFIVLKDFNFQFAIKELHVGPFVRPLDEVQKEKMDIETSDQAFFELRVFQKKKNPVVRTEFDFLKDEKRNPVELEIVSRESAGSGSEYLFFRSNDLKPGTYEASFEFNDYSEKKVRVQIFCGLNKYALDDTELEEMEPEGLPKFLDNEVLTSQMKDLKVEDFYRKQEQKKIYRGEIPKVKRKKKTIALKSQKEMNKENYTPSNTFPKKKISLSKKTKIKKKKPTNEKRKKIKLSKKKPKKKVRKKFKTEDSETDQMTSNENRMKAIFSENPTKERDQKKNLEGSMQTIPENPSEVNSKGFKNEGFSGNEDINQFDSIMAETQNLNQDESRNEEKEVNSDRKTMNLTHQTKTLKNRSTSKNHTRSASKRETGNSRSSKKRGSSKKKGKTMNSYGRNRSNQKMSTQSPLHSHFHSTHSSFKMTPKNNAPFQASFNNEVSCKPLTSRSINQQNSTVKKEEDSKKARITSGNRIRPGERLPSAKSKASPSDHVQIQSRQAIPSFISSRKEEISFMEWFSEFEKRVDHGAINIFCSKSTCLDCSFILSETEPPRPIKSFNVCDGAFQQVMIPLSIDKPILCRLFFEIIKPQVDEEVVVVLYSCNNWLAFRLSDYIRSTCAFSDNERFCDLALCNLSTGVMLPMLALTRNRPEVGTGISEIRKLVLFVNNSKFGVSKFFGFDEEQVEDKAKEYTLSLAEAKESLNNYEITGDLDYLLNSVRCNRSGDISLALIERIYQIWQELVKQTESFDLEESFEEEEFDDLEDSVEQDSAFAKNDFDQDPEYNDSFVNPAPS